MRRWSLDNFPPRALESSCTCCLFVSRVLEHLGVPEVVETLQVDHHCLQCDILTTLGGNVWCSWGAKTTSARYFTKEWSVRNLLILLYGRNGPLPEMASFNAQDAKPHHSVIETANSHPRARAPASKIRPAASKTAPTPSRYNHVKATMLSGQPLPCSKSGEATKTSWTSNLVPASLVKRNAREGRKDHLLWSARHLSSWWSGCSGLCTTLIEKLFSSHEKWEDHQESCAMTLLCFAGWTQLRRCSGKNNKPHRKWTEMANQQYISPRQPLNAEPPSSVFVRPKPSQKQSMQRLRRRRLQRCRLIYFPIFSNQCCPEGWFNALMFGAEAQELLHMLRAQYLMQLLETAVESEECWSVLGMTWRNHSWSSTGFNASIRAWLPTHIIIWYYLSGGFSISLAKYCS